MRRILYFILCLILVAVGLVIAAVSVIWWVVLLVAFPIMFAGAVGAMALHDAWRSARKQDSAKVVHD